MDGELALELLSRLLDIDSPRLLSLAVLSPLRIIQKSNREGRSPPPPRPMVLVGGRVTTANLEWHSSTVPDGEILNSWIKFQHIHSKVGGAKENYA